MQTWPAEAIAANHHFRQRISPDQLPVRGPGGRAVITCIDPRINLEAIGISQFAESGRQESQVRIIRTIGAKVDERSLLIGVFLAGIRDITILAHTDCGCGLAHGAIASIAERMHRQLDPGRLAEFEAEVGRGTDNLRLWLKTFEDPRQGVLNELERIRSLPFCPADLTIHGLVYDVETGGVEIVHEDKRATGRA